jgi:hypothetical protein
MPKMSVMEVINLTDRARVRECETSEFDRSTSASPYPFVQGPERALRHITAAS